MNKKLVVLGAGESGTGTARLAKAKGFDVFVSDFGKIADQYKEELNLHQIPFEEEGHDFDRILEADEIVKSPGIPEKAPIMLAIRERNIKVSSEIDFAARYTSAKIIAITGTNGKTTTTLLTYHLLKENGYHVGLAGNIGFSFARCVLEKDYDWYVLEISSFQLDDIHTFKPDIAMLLNITPDHLDRYHDDINEYAASKFHIIENMDEKGVFIFNNDDPIILKAKENKNIIPQEKPFGNDFTIGKNAVQIAEIGVFENLPIRGPHNMLNASAAILAATQAGLGREKILTAIPSFKNTEHRLEEVTTIHHITFVNDSKATNVDAAKFALDSFGKNIIWIAGGTDKGNDYQVILPLVEENVKHLICLGKDNEKLISSFKSIFSDIQETQNTDEAVKKAFSLAKEGDVVLLSPACASFDLFKNYMDRGDQFKASVLNLQSELEEK